MVRMRVEKGKVRAPEIGRVWLNSTPLSFRQLRGRVVLVDFWDYTCVNCIRTLPYVQAWHERYRDKGLTVIGVHTPEFTFAQYESNVERGIREFGLTYPIVIDSDREIWKAFANRYWPTKYLLDKDGYLRFGHFGEGGYGECEQVIQELLREIDPAIDLPALMDPMREEDPWARFAIARLRRTLSWASAADGSATKADSKKIRLPTIRSPGQLEETFFYASGRWASTAEYFEAVEAGPHTLRAEVRGLRRKLGHGLSSCRLRRGRRPAGWQATHAQAGYPRHSFPRPVQMAEESYIAVRVCAHVFSGRQSRISGSTNWNCIVPPELPHSRLPSPVASIPSASALQAARPA